MEKEECKDCFFCDEKALKEGKAHCTYPGKVYVNAFGHCQAFRVKEAK